MVTDFMLNPNIAYLLLVSGFLLIIMALLTPGTGVLEVGAVFAFVLAAWQIYSIPINIWALLLLVLGVIPFLLAVRHSGNLWYLVASIATLVVGSTYLFQGSGWLPAVNPVLALIVSTTTAGLIWFVTVKTLDAHVAPTAHNIDDVIGAEGLTRTIIHTEGAVWVKMEEWSARSEASIPPGTRIRVVDRQGLILDVEPLQSE